MHSIPSVPQRAKRQWIDEGDAHYDAGRYKEAIAAYSRAIQLDPRDADIYCDRGRAYYDLKEYQWAIASFDRALELKPNFSRAKNERAKAYARNIFQI